MQLTPRIGFVGVGAAGGALARALLRAGHPPVVVAARWLAHAAEVAAAIPGCAAVSDTQEVVNRSELIFLAVPDDYIEEVCEALSWRPGVSVVHCSGALSTDVLEGARRDGVLVGSFHPLQTFTGAVEDVDLVSGSTIGIEAEATLMPTLWNLALAIGGRPLRLTGHSKALYHVAAVMASNYVITLVVLAATLMEQVGMGREDAVDALLPLTRGSVANLASHGLPGALTGPIARGDVDTVIRHLEALRRVEGQVGDIYRELARATLPIASERRRADVASLRAIGDLMERKIAALEW